MCGGEKYFFTIPYFTYDLLRKLHYLDLSVVLAQLVQKGGLNLSSRCCVVSVNRIRSWRRCYGFIVWQARDRVALFWRSSVGVNTCRAKRLSNRVGRRHPVTNCKPSCMGLSTRRVCLLRHQTRTQYSAAEWIKARLAVRNVLASEPHLKPANCFKSPT